MSSVKLFYTVNGSSIFSTEAAGGRPPLQQLDII